MPRKVAEWRGSSPDAKVPPRVRLRIFEAYGERCQCGCNRKIMTGEKWDLDDKKALVNGGERRESNLHPLLTEHHKTKTRSDVAEKSRTYKRRAQHVGIKLRTGRSFRTNKDQPWKKKISGEVVRR